MTFKSPALLRWLRARRRAALVAALVLLLGWPPLAWLAAGGLIVTAELQRADAIVVLAGSAAYRERAGLAAQLFREGRAPRVLLTDDGELSGWSEELQRNPRFVERAAGELARAGVPAEGVEVLPRTVSSTYEEAVLLRDYAARRGLRSVLLVTSAYHSRRALWTFRKVFEGSGVEVGLVGVAPGDQSPPPSTWWLWARGWRMVAGEYLKMIYYRVRYG